MSIFAWLKKRKPAPIVDVAAPHKLVVNNAGIELIKSFEGCKLKPYLCSAKVPTVGYGATRGLDGNSVAMGSREITQAEADKLFERDINYFAARVRPLVSVDLNNNQFSALVSLAYNIGLGNFGGSTLLRKLNEGDYLEAANQFLVWRKAGGKVLAGLERRRAAERELFLTP